jgi:hypothetical protein
MKTAENGECGLTTHPQSEPEQHPQAALALFYAADLPFTFVGDVLTWPYTAAYSFINQPVPVPPVTHPPLFPPPPAIVAPPPVTAAEVGPQASPPQSVPKPTDLP